MREPLDWLGYLDAQRMGQLNNLKLLDAYYEGNQPLKYMVPELEDEFGDRITQLVINWPRLGVDAYENRLDVEGFRLPGAGSTDDELWRIWQDNDLDEVSPQAHLEALIARRSYVIVGPNEDDEKTPIISVEHPTQMMTYHDPRTREVVWGLKRWRDDADTGTPVDHAALYGQTVDRYYVMEKGSWRLTDEREHDRGMCAVIPIVNRGRLMHPLGTSEFADVIPIANAANKMATDMMISGEFHAMPRRWIFGMSQDEFKDKDGNALSTWQQMAGQIWATDRSPEEVRAGQFAEADLAVFHNTIRTLAQVASQLLALPPHYMSFTTDNPASADAIRSSEAQLVKRVERKQRTFGGSWEKVMRLARMIATGSDDPKMRRMETIWRNAATPTVAQKADAAVKLYNAGIVPLRQTREDMGYNDAQIKLMEKEDDKAAAKDPLTEIAQGLADRVGNDAVADRPGQEPPPAESDPGTAAGRVPAVAGRRP